MEDSTSEGMEEKKPLPSFLQKAPYNQFPDDWKIKILKEKKDIPIFFLIKKKG